MYLAILMRKMWDELLEELLGGDSGVHQLAQGDVGLLPHTFSCVSQPDIYMLIEKLSPSSIFIGLQYAPQYKSVFSPVDYAG